MRIYNLRAVSEARLALAKTRQNSSELRNSIPGRVCLSLSKTLFLGTKVENLRSEVFAHIATMIAVRSLLTVGYQAP